MSAEALELLGEYLSSHVDRTAWRRLVSVYDSAMQAHRQDLADDATSSMYHAVLGSKAALRRAAGHDREHDAHVVNSARSTA